MQDLVLAQAPMDRSTWSILKSPGVGPELVDPRHPELVGQRTTTSPVDTPGICDDKAGSKATKLVVHAHDGILALPNAPYY